ncbi:MAG: nicotinate-nicotinamide nucleotide adenylyltransferase [Deltaproteobacteria bacterium]|nr:nicotinate-nicotinamide nucleotide adenylyltransferase [Deltaproteobacteria bacterium]
MKIALFGGAFNPPHQGHLQIVSHLLKEGYDQVWIIPCWQHPLGKGSISFWHRFHLCRLAFKGMGPKVRVRDVERRLHLSRSWTVNTVSYLRKKYPNRKFTLVVGQDNFEQRKKWKNFDKIEQLVSVVSIPRGVSSFVLDVSSSQIRERMGSGQQVKDLLQENVLHYLLRKGLYVSKTNLF